MTDEAAASILAQTGSYLDQFESDPQPLLLPGFSVRDDRAWSAVPAIRHMPRIVGKGRNAHEVVEPVPHMLALSSDHLFVPYDEQALTPYALRPHPKPFIPKPPFRWDMRDIKSYVVNKEKGPPTEEVFTNLVDIWRDYVEFGDSVYYELMALYVMQSYMFTVWPTTGYLHFNGTLASGKSRCLDVLECVAFNARQGSSFSPSVIYRILEGSPGVLCMDEQEMFKTDDGKVLYSQLLGGYRSQGAAYVNDKGKDDSDWSPTAYSLYGPKAIASINQVEPTLASRSIIIPMVPAVKQPAELPVDHEYWRPYRHELYVWALQNALPISRHTKGWNEHARFARAPGLINRAWEVARPYLVIADTFDQRLVERMVAFFDDYFSEQRKRMQETDKALMLLRALPRVMALGAPDVEQYYSVTRIHEALLALTDADQRDYVKTRHVHTHLTTLRFKDRRTVKGTIHYRLDEAQLRNTFLARSVQPLEEDLPWLEGKVSYAKEAPTQATMESIADAWMT